MTTFYTLLVFISIAYFIVSYEAVDLSKDNQQFVLRGRVTFSGGSRIPIEKNAKLTVQLQDTSFADAPANVIAQGTAKAIRFPIVFGIKYSSKQIISGNTYTLHATIKNKKNELLYTNDVQIKITPIGVSRTKSIDVPVILAKKTKSESKKSQWPELVGKKGEDAVRIIKKETGFTNVMTIKEGSPITYELNYSRVRVTVNDKGIVTTVPIIA